MSDSKKLAPLAAGLGSGMLSAYFLDPYQGKRRRHRINESLTHFKKAGSSQLEKSTRDLYNRTKGSAVRSAKRLSFSDRFKRVDDETLTARVRSTLGRYTSHPHSIGVQARDGNVTLTGPVLRSEVPSLLSAVEAVRGVRSLDSRLEVHPDRGRIPSLQGGRPKQGQTLDIFQTNWAPATRMLGTFGGATLVVSALIRRTPLSLLAAPAGALLFLRALTNRSVSQLTGIGKGKRRTVRKIIEIEAPIDRVFDFFACFENFPSIMKDLRSVRLSEDGCISHWQLSGPAGRAIRWDAQITRLNPYEEIAWKTLPESPIHHAGRIHLRPITETKTRVEMTFSFDPPAGILGEAAAKFFGVDPKSEFDEGLAELKSFLEK